MTLLLPYGPLHGIHSSLVKQAARFMIKLDSAELYDFAVSLGIGLSVAEPLWHQFIADGYIGKSADGRHVPTQRMEQLRMARFGKPLPRKKAETLLQQAIDNAKAVNAEPPSAQLFYVTSLAVFGSFLDESKQELGDLDLAWTAEPRPGTEDFMFQCLYYGKDPIAPTRGLVKPKSSFVRLTNMSTVLELECPYKVVYEIPSHILEQSRLEWRKKRLEQETPHQEQMARLDAKVGNGLSEPKTRSRRKS